jgi:hypothetical protein
MNVDENNMMSLTGTTTLPENTQLALTVTASPRPLSQGNATGTTGVRGDAHIIAAAGGGNRWKGIIDISPLPPADYTITLVTIAFAENFTKIIESEPLVTHHFTLGDEHPGPDIIRKKTHAALPFIRIDPSDQKPATGSREITGITSLAPGTPLVWTMHAITNGTDNNTQESGGTTLVIPGTEGINRWSVLPGTDMPEPARYQFSINGNPIGNTSPAGTISASSDFEGYPVPGTLQKTTGTRQVPPGFITIDPLPEIRTNGKYVISGTTSLPAGEGLVFQIYPASFFTEYNFTFDRNKGERADFSGVTGMVGVVNGSSGYNLWSIDFHTYNLAPGRYAVNVSNDKFDPAASAMVPGDLFGSGIFTITG